QRQIVAYVLLDAALTLVVGNPCLRVVCNHAHPRVPYSFPTRRSSDLSNLSETAEVPACNVPSRSPLPALAIAPETKLGTASSGLGTLEPRSEERRVGKECRSRWSWEP